MKRWLKIFLVSAALVLAGFLTVTGWYLSRAIPIGTGYVAKYLCTSTFISQREPDAVFEEDVRPVNPLAKVMKWEVDRKGKVVAAKALWFFTSRAIYRKGCGCTLLAKTDEASLRRQDFFAFPKAYQKPAHPADAPWPDGAQGPVDPAFLGMDTEKLQQAVAAAFAEPSPDRPRRTHAVVVVYDGHLVAEHYAPGFGPGMPLPGWSMTKSITNALVGILVKQGKLDIHTPAPVAQWQKADDPRHAITLDQLLRMSSGLQFDEVYDPLYDATDMLYGAYDFAAFAAGKKLETKPDSKWSYSSGTANIVARIVRNAAEKTDDHYYDFIRRELFDKIGMTRALIEPDGSGTFVGSSYGVATPRDWARFGLLFLNDGVWKDERILPEGWVKYTATPTPGAPKGEYGAHFWLNAGAPGHPENRPWPDAPRDTIAAQGYQGQRVIIIPSKKLVLVRFGATSHRPSWDTNAFIRDVIRAVPG